MNKKLPIELEPTAKHLRRKYGTKKPHFLNGHEITRAKSEDEFVIEIVDEEEVIVIVED
ncbi:hypothetical protein O0550_23680 [Brevibacillus halotolerans]|uniref:hypothetical protein n=1 Tax=Brevibacillus TaxID=55080 RepID=UPI00215BF250|nr:MULTISPECIES: hypothetical protein [Brevibacillus]MCR8966147.1 hypothetical protein [Brevibacillus laterosporus]MCZ0838304.1 hypothetical protein [Brevibacillus halotolerans]